MATHEREITEPVDLCTPDGRRLNPLAKGWSRTPQHRANLQGVWGRTKRWDYWAILAGDLAVAITYGDVEYLGTVAVWWADLRLGTSGGREVVAPLGRGLALPDVPGTDPLRFRSAHLDVDLVDDERGTTLTARWDEPDGTPGHLHARVDLPEGHESVNVVIPWSDRRYQCTTKDVARPASGTITWGDHRTTMTTDGRSWGCLDFGRGRWPYRTTWNWGAGAGLVGEERVGLQLGGKWTDGTGMTENALVVDGRLSKLSEELVWTYDREDWLRPWRVRTPRSDRVELTFTPIHDKVSRLQAGVAANAVDQCFGHWSGRVRPDDHDVIEIDGVFGWAEEATWRW